jgi:hypothetical protein
MYRKEQNDRKTKTGTGSKILQILNVIRELQLNKLYIHWHNAVLHLHIFMILKVFYHMILWFVFQHNLQIFMYEMLG